MRILALFLTFIILVQNVCAITDVDEMFELSFTDSIEGKRLSDLTIRLYEQGNGRKEQVHVGLLSSDGVALVALDGDGGSLIAELDDLDTIFPDYITDPFVLGIGNSRSMMVSAVPVGEIRGRLETVAGKPLGGYYLELTCPGVPGIRTAKADGAGDFIFPLAPATGCAVKTVHNGKSQDAQVNISRGQLTTVTLKVGKTGMDPIALARAAGAFLFLALLSFLLYSYIDLKRGFPKRARLLPKGR